MFTRTLGIGLMTKSNVRKIKWNGFLNETKISDKI